MNAGGFAPRGQLKKSRVLETFLVVTTGWGIAKHPTMHKIAMAWVYLTSIILSKKKIQVQNDDTVYRIISFI